MRARDKALAGEIGIFITGLIAQNGLTRTAAAGFRGLRRGAILRSEARAKGRRPRLLTGLNSRPIASNSGRRLFIFRREVMARPPTKKGGPFAQLRRAKGQATRDAAHYFSTCGKTAGRGRLVGVICLPRNTVFVSGRLSLVPSTDRAAKSIPRGQVSGRPIIT